MHSDTLPTPPDAPRAKPGGELPPQRSTTREPGPGIGTVLVGLLAIALISVAMVGWFALSGDRDDGPVRTSGIANPADYRTDLAECRVDEATAVAAGTLANLADEPVSYRLSVAFASEDGAHAGHYTYLSRRLEPGATEPFTVQSGATFERPGVLCRIESVSYTNDGA